MYQAQHIVCQVCVATDFNSIHALIEIHNIYLLLIPIKIQSICTCNYNL